MSKISGLLFWHKILILLSISMIAFTIGIGLVVWRLLDHAGKTMGEEEHLRFFLNRLRHLSKNQLSSRL